MGYKVEQHQVTQSSPYWDYCDTVCFTSKNLYNSAQFTNRQSFIYGHGHLSFGKLDKVMKSNEHYKSLPAKVAQLVLKQSSEAWDSFFKAQKEYKKNPSKFTGKPKPPGYLETGLTGRNLVKFNMQAVSKTQFKKGFINPSKSPIMLPIKPGLEWDDMVEVRIVPKLNTYNIEVVYDDGLEEFKSPESWAASIDIGLDALATITFSNPTVQPIVINGKPLKSANQWMNKEVARLRQCLGYNGTTSRIKNVITKRNNRVHTYLHQATRRIAQICDDYGITHVAIGQNEQWKTSINIGGRNNQNFVQIPHAKFIDMLTRKLEELGITVIVGEESYTSKASFLDWDNIPTYDPENPQQHSFSGKRVATKKYRTSDGTVIHADVNGSFNIGRKVLPQFFGDELRTIVMRDKGCVVAHPRRVDVRRNPFQMTS